jgi:long-chain acyl-CoA synthetase
VCIGEGAVERSDADFESLLSQGQPAPAPDLDPMRDLAAILYTSGTTGHPKGAMLSHDNLVSNTRSVRAALQLRAGEDRLLVVLPMFHSFAATVGLLTPALHGLSMVPVIRFDPGLVSESIGLTGATVFLGVPSMYNLILRLGEEQARHWHRIRFGVAGGAAMPVELLKKFEQRFGFPIVEGDGPTECSPVTCVNPLDGERKPGSVGLPVPDVEFAIMDDAGNALPDGEIGEICVRGPNVMQGYWNLPEATAETFFDDWLRTGDLGYLDADGYIFMVDRKKDMVIVNGMNVYPRMVEEVLYQHPGILEAAVVGEPHPSHGEIVVAHVVAREGFDLDDHELKTFCREQLGQHQMPRRFVVHESLPKNATGKILKRELRRAGEVERGIIDPR